MAKDVNINVKLEDWVEQIVQRAAGEAASTALKEHRQECPINDLAKEIWGGPGGQPPGMKAALAGVSQEVNALKRCKGFLRDIAKPVIAAVIVAAIFWAMQQYAKDAKATAKPPQTPTERTRK